MFEYIEAEGSSSVGSSVLKYPSTLVLAVFNTILTPIFRPLRQLRLSVANKQGIYHDHAQNITNFFALCQDS